MSAQEWALQTGIRAALLADPGVAALLGAPPRLYDEVPEEAVFPYLTFGRAESAPEDGDDAPLLTHVVHLHVWSRYGGRKEAKEALAAVRAALHGQDLALEGCRLVSLRATFADVLRAADGRTTQAILRLRAMTEPLEA